MLRITAFTLALSACTLDAAIPEEADPADTSETSGSIAAGEPNAAASLIQPPPEALVTDTCDDPTYDTAPWKDYASEHFWLSFPEGSQADFDKVAIANRLEAAYADIRSQLGVANEPTLYVYLSPSRTAAAANYMGMGQAWTGYQRYDVVYTGAADSYELTRYGQLLTVSLDYYMDTANRYRVPVLATGVAELLDQSGRNLHNEYAKQLVAGNESRVRIAELDEGDVWGSNVGRAGSLVQFLVNRYGMLTFMDIYRQTAVTWSGNCYRNANYGCIESAEQVTALLDGVLQQTVGETFSELRPMWQAQVEDALVRISAGMDSDTVAEIKNVFAVMDKAITTDSAFLYRTTIEGFYCDWGGESSRTEIAARAVAAYGSMRTQVLAVYDTGTKNFATANAFVMRQSDDGIPMFETVNLEHLPVGWRVTYSPDWY
jgi:hypothetical protein